MRQMNWHRVFSAENRLIESIDRSKDNSIENAVLTILENRHSAKVSGNVTLEQLLKSKQSSTPSAQ